MRIGILFITFYGKIDYIREIIDSFNNLVDCSSVGKNTDNTKMNLETIKQFPYLKYKTDKSLSHNQIEKMIINEINKYAITHIFWFFFPDINVIKNVRDITGAKNIFYNFDDPLNFNISLIQNLQHIDYVIIPSKRNERKYTYILDKYVHTIPMFMNTYIFDILLLPNITSIDPSPFVLCDDKNTHYDNDNDNDNDNNNDNDNVNVCMGIDQVKQYIYDVSIVIDDNDYVKYDKHEKNIIYQYIQKIKEYCITNNLSLNMYGNIQLKNSFSDIYIDTIESLNYVIANSKIIIILDLRNGLDKGSCNLIDKCTIYNVPVLTNFNQSNNLIYDKMGSSLVKIISLDNLQIISDTLNCMSYIQICGAKKIDREINPDIIFTVDMWASKILNILI